MLKRVERDSNYELLRIISMFFIVLWHVIQHSNVLGNVSGVSNFVLNAIMLFIVVHVNCFLLITGYYQSKSTFKLKKLLSLILEIWFYNFIINFVLKFSGLVSYTNVDFLTRISFFNLDTFWYIKCYIIVYLLSPFLNLLINKIDKKTYKKLILCLILVFSIIPFFTLNLFSDITAGLSIQIMLYFIGAYIRKYDIDNEITKKINITKKRTIYIGCFLGFWFINLMLYVFENFLCTLDSNILNYVGIQLANFKFLYNNPITILQALSIFMFFGTLKIKSKVINKISSLTLGIYFIHEMRYVYMNIYKWIGLDTGNEIYSNAIILKVLFWAIIIFVTCAIIEFLRQCLFKLLIKFKIVNKTSNKITDFFHKLFLIES